MKYKAIAVLTLACACGGTSTQTLGGDDAGTTPPEAVVPMAGTYKATAASTAFRSAIAPVGPAPGTTLITDWGGSFYMVLPNYDFVKGSLRVNQDGTLSVGTGNVLAHQDGRVEPAVIVGTSVGSTIAATVNGQSFSVALTDIATQDFAVSKMVGNYVSTSSSAGNWIAISIAASDPYSPEYGSIYGYAYVSQADMQAGIALRAGGYPDNKAVGHYLGSIRHTDVPVSCAKPCTPTPNSFTIGFAYYEDVAPFTRHDATSGFAYFTATGLVVLTVQQNTGEQLTAAFSRQ